MPAVTSKMRAHVDPLRRHRKDAMQPMQKVRLDRQRYAGLKTAIPTRGDVTWGQARAVDVMAGAVLSITNVGGGAGAWLTALAGGAAGHGGSA